jgi:hypothetical protein
MRGKRTLTKIAVAAIAGAIGLTTQIELRDSRNSGVVQFPLAITVPTADARIGRPATPLSVAGVTRRTTRRTVRRRTYYSGLPAGCAWRAPYHYCGGIYYEPVIQDGKEVYIIVNP